MHLRSALSGSVLQLSVEDHWTASTLPLIAPQLDALEFAGLDRLEIDAARASLCENDGSTEAGGIVDPRFKTAV